MLNPLATQVEVQSSMVLELLSYACVGREREDPESVQQPAYVRLPAYVLLLMALEDVLRAGSG